MKKFWVFVSRKDLPIGLWDNIQVNTPNNQDAWDFALAISTNPMYLAVLVTKVYGGSLGEAVDLVTARKYIGGQPVDWEPDFMEVVGNVARCFEIDIDTTKSLN